ncbi:MAG: Stk1 family PASTA domain-containing Ser/Thr kinase [Lachnospiraceae bacterium]|nr:Stk1 family PASTA domain-containing Ser/Thr kinase [Lachnospiraceae bacterium]
MDRIGTILAGRYELLSQIGSGGMADVFKAMDLKLDREVAVKILRAEFSQDENFLKRFDQEAKAAASIHSPNVVNIYDVGEDKDVNFIVMELADGITLKEYIQKKGKLDIIEAINISMQIAAGIREAHLHGIIHRDIKPQNVIVSPEGIAKVMDFGIAKAVTAQTITANTVGSVHYISPEQARGSTCDERCDIYSLGITMYEMITGRVPYDGDSNVAIALAHIKEPITPPSTYEPMIPVSLEKIIMKCTQKKPEYRYSSADELIDDLKTALMTPDEDFVKKADIPEDGATKIFSDNDVSAIRKEAGSAPSAVKTKEEEDYQLGLEEPDDDEDDPEDDDDDSYGRKEKILLGIGIGALLIIIMITGGILARAFHIFPGSGNQESTTESSSETLAEDEIYMPAVENIPLEEAENILRQAGLGRKIEKVESNDVEEGYVISAEDEDGNPVQAGDVVKKNSQIRLYVSSGKETTVIPENIIGQTSEVAKAALEKIGLVVTIQEAPSNDYDTGYVFECSPGVNEKVTVGSTVTIYVSTGAAVKLVKVPNMLERTTDTARYMVETADLEWGSPSFEYSETISKDKIISQSVDPGTEVEAGTVITVVVSLGPEERTVPVPDLQGMTKSQADSALTGAGLKLGSITEQYDDSVPEGCVITQSIKPKKEVEEGTSVDVIISLGSQEPETESKGDVGSGDDDGDPGFADSGESGYERNHADSSDDFDGEDKSFANGSAFEADGSIVHQDSLDWYVSSDGFNRFIQYTYD